MLYIYKYFRLCYLYFEDHNDPFFKALGFVHIGVYISILLLISVFDFFWPNYILLPELPKRKFLFPILLYFLIYCYAFKALLVKVMKVSPDSGISHRYYYNPSPKAVKINFITHVVILTLFLLFGYLRKY